MITKDNIAKMGTGVLLYKNSNDFPVIVPIQYTIVNQNYTIIPAKGLEIESLTNATLIIKFLRKNTLRFQNLSLQGKLTRDNSGLFSFEPISEKIEIIDATHNLTSQLIASLPDGFEQIREINTKLAQRVLNSSNEALILLNVSNNIHIETINFNYISNMVKFQLSHNSKIKSLLHYTNKATLIVPSEKDAEGHILFSGRIKSVKTQNRGVVNSIMDDYFQFQPMNMEYGKQSNWERIQLTSQPSLEILDFLQSFKYKIRYWSAITRVQLFIFSLLPLLIGSVMFLPTETSLDLKVLLLEIFTLFFFQSAANMFNDYFDHKSESDEYAVFQSKLNAGSRLLQLGLISSSQLKIYSSVFLFLGAILGFYINMITEGNDILIIGIIGGLVLLSYNFPPINLSYRWHGDILFSLIIFPIVVVGGNFTQTQNYNSIQELILVGIGMSFLIISMLFIGNMIAFDAEKAAKKITFTVRFGKNKTIKFIYVLLALFYLVQVIVISTVETIMFLPLVISLLFTYGAINHITDKNNDTQMFRSRYEGLARIFISYYSIFFLILIFV